MNKQNWWIGDGMIKSIKDAVIFDKRKGVEYEVTDILLSVEEIVKGKVKITIIPLECWGIMSKACKSFEEGDMVRVEGRFANKKWRDSDEVERKLNLIVVESIKAL